MIASLPISDGAFYNLAPPLRLQKPTSGGGNGRPGSPSPTAGGGPSGARQHHHGGAVLEDHNDDAAEFNSVAAAAAAIEAAELEQEKEKERAEPAYLAAPSGYEYELLGSGVDGYSVVVKRPDLCDTSSLP